MDQACNVWLTDSFTSRINFTIMHNHKNSHVGQQGALDHKMPSSDEIMLEKHAWNAVTRGSQDISAEDIRGSLMNLWKGYRDKRNIIYKCTIMTRLEFLSEIDQ